MGGVRAGAQRRRATCRYRWRRDQAQRGRRRRRCLLARLDPMVEGLEDRLGVPRALARVAVRGRQRQCEGGGHEEGMGDSGFPVGAVFYAEPQSRLCALRLREKI